MRTTYINANSSDDLFSKCVPIRHKSFFYFPDLKFFFLPFLRMLLLSSFLPHTNLKENPWVLTSTMPFNRILNNLEAPGCRLIESRVPIGREGDGQAACSHVSGSRVALLGLIKLVVSGQVSAVGKRRKCTDHALRVSLEKECFEHD